MATLVFTALGSALGGPLFAAAGAIAGSLVDGALIGGSTREGPRLSRLAITTSSYGDSLPRHFGRMRAAGSLIWATDLVEQSETSGGGKGKPTVKSYTYSCSFAVALASRPIADVGRVWADGNLLRGADGVLKSGGTMRIHTGHGDQDVDPLIAAAEGVARCPAWRGIAYVVFENLQLADYGNRIPALNFEILADDGALRLDRVLDGVIENLAADMVIDGVSGLTLDATPGDLLETLKPVFPIYSDAANAQLRLVSEARVDPVVLGDAATSSAKGDFGSRAGYLRRRAVAPESPPRLLRYYDVERDYQPGLQRAGGRPLPGQPRTVDLPAAMAAIDAQRIIARAASVNGWARETLQWRTTELDPAVAPGSVVSPPGQPGAWRVLAWEWRDKGVELSLERISQIELSAGVGAAGRANLAADLALGKTDLVAFELPWDGVGQGDSRALYAAVSSAGAGWSGAELGVDRGDGVIVPLGPSGRARSVIGTVVTVLPEASPHVIDRQGSVIVELLGDDMALRDAAPRALAMGENRALAGGELIQFIRAVPLGTRRWRLEGLLRGRGGTEYRIGGHSAGEPFVLLDEAPVALDATLVGSSVTTVITALGLADETAAESAIIDSGLTLQPMAPVHPRATITAGGGLLLQWTRRARGAWTWLDGVDAPLHEQAESYEVAFQAGTSVIARWEVATPALELSPAQVAALRAQAPAGQMLVRQRGTYALSPALRL